MLIFSFSGPLSFVMLIYLIRGPTTWTAASFVGCCRAYCWHNIQGLWLPFLYSPPSGVLVGDRVGSHLLRWKLMVPCSRTSKSPGRTMLPTKASPGQFLYSSFNHPCSKLSLMQSNGGSPEKRLGWNKLSNLHFITIYYTYCLGVGTRGLWVRKETQKYFLPFRCFSSGWGRG